MKEKALHMVLRDTKVFKDRGTYEGGNGSRGKRKGGYRTK